MGGRSGKARCTASTPLTPKEKRFVEQYMIDLNGTQAVIRAGYNQKPNVAAVTASQLLRKPNVASTLKRVMAERSAKTGITQERVLRELELLAFSDAEEHYRVGPRGTVKLHASAPAGATRALASIKRKFVTRIDDDGETEETCDVEIRLWDKPSMLKLAGRHVGLFPDKIEIEPGSKFREALAQALQGESE